MVLQGVARAKFQTVFKRKAAKCRTVKGHACIVITMNDENTQSIRDSKYMFARKCVVDVKPRAQNIQSSNFRKKKYSSPVYQLNFLFLNCSRNCSFLSAAVTQRGLFNLLCYVIRWSVVIASSQRKVSSHTNLPNLWSFVFFLRGLSSANFRTLPNPPPPKRMPDGRLMMWNRVCSRKRE